MKNEEKAFTARNGEALASVEVNIGDHAEYLQRVNNGRVKFFALYSEVLKEGPVALPSPPGFLKKQYLRLVLTAHDKTRISQKKEGSDGIVSEINQLVDQHIRSERIILEKLPRAAYGSLDSFLVENSDQLHHYVGHKQGVLPTNESKLIITDLLAQQVRSASAQKEPSPEASAQTSTNYPLIITYRVDNYRGEETDPLADSLPKMTASGWLKILLGLCLLPFAFLFYYCRLWQKLLARVQSFFSS